MLSSPSSPSVMDDRETRERIGDMPEMVAGLLSVVVPTYGAVDSLEPLLRRLRSVLEERNQLFEVIIVNDHSPDGSWAVLQRLAPEFPELRAIDLLSNHGQARATMCGLAHARGELVATMDDDLQHPPEELPKLLDALAAHPEWDAVVGAWPRDEGPLRNLGSYVHHLADRFAHGTPKSFRHSGYRVMRCAAVAAMVAHETRNPIVGPLLRQIANVHNVDVAHHPRAFGRSGFRAIDGMRHVLNNFLHGSALPLRLISRFGMLCSLFAFFVGALYLGRWMVGYRTPPGWASSFLAVVFFGGATLFSVGILGEYIHLTLGEVRRPPRWSIRQEIRGRA